jgi:serine/threonine-protein kinase RsbW
MEGKYAIETIQLSVGAKLSNLAGIRNFVHTALIPYCNNEDFLYELALVVEEAVANIIIHGYRGEQGVVTLMILPNEGCVEIVLQDDAPPFDPTSVPAPRLDLPLELRPLGGLGIHIIRKYSEKMVYQQTPTGLNELKIYKSFPLYSESAQSKMKGR